MFLYNDLWSLAQSNKFDATVNVCREWGFKRRIYDELFSCVKRCKAGMSS